MNPDMKINRVEINPKVKQNPIEKNRL
ncbi:MAG: hypothetical protein Lokiarch_06880, partial [Candidatus Lokiarchaeum sp. GC14_75]